MEAVARWALLAGLLSGCVGAGGGEPVVRAARPSVSVSQLRLQVVPRSGTPPEVVSSVRASLVSRGYNVVEGDPADLAAVIHVQRAVERGLLTIVRNGREVINYRTVVVLQVTDGESVVALAKTEFEGEEGEVDEGAIASLASSLSTSASLKDYAAEAQRRQDHVEEEHGRQADEARERLQVAEQETLRKRDETSWLDARLRECEAPRSLDACRGVQQYLIEFPHGIHAEEAKRLVVGAEGALLDLGKDDSAWQQSGWEACVQGAPADDCSGIELYLLKYPAGLHNVAARRQLREASSDQQGLAHDTR